MFGRQSIDDDLYWTTIGKCNNNVNISDVILYVHLFEIKFTIVLNIKPVCFIYFLCRVKIRVYESPRVVLDLQLSVRINYWIQNISTDIGPWTFDERKKLRRINFFFFLVGRLEKCIRRLYTWVFLPRLQRFGRLFVQNVRLFVVQHCHCRRRVWWTRARINDVYDIYLFFNTTPKLIYNVLR